MFVDIAIRGKSIADIFVVNMKSPILLSDVWKGFDLQPRTPIGLYEILKLIWDNPTI